MDLQTGQPEDRYHARIILLLLYTMKLFALFSESKFSKILYFLRSGVGKSGHI